MNKGKRVLLLVVFMFVTVFAGWAGGKQEEKGEIPAETVALKFVLPHWNKASQDALEGTIIPDFIKTHPKVKDVEVDYTSFGKMMEKITTAFAGGISPDSFEGGAVYTPMMVHNEWALPLDDFIAKSPEFDFDDYYPVYRDDVSMKGHIWAIPFIINSRTFIYRESFLKEAGVKPPDTWEELEKAAIKLTVRDSSGRITRCGFNYSSYPSSSFQINASFLPFLHQAGATILNTDGTKCTLNSPEAVEALEEVYKLIKVLKVCPEPVGMGRIGGVAPIVLGKAAMKGGANTQLIAMMKQYNPQEYNDLKAEFSLRHKVRRGHVYINKIFISNQTKYPELSWEWVKHLCGKEYLPIFSEAFRSLSGRKSQLEDQWVKEDHLLPVWVKQSEYSVAYPKVPFMFQTFKPIQDAQVNVLMEKMTAKDALKEATARIDTIIKTFK